MPKTQISILPPPFLLKNPQKMARIDAGATEQYRHLFQKLDAAFEVHGRDKIGRRIVRVVGKFFPARDLAVLRPAGAGEEMLRRYLEERVFSELGVSGRGEAFVIVYAHAGVRRSENFPGVAALRTAYEAVPAAVRGRLEAVYFVHPGLQARLFFATVGRFLFSDGLYGKIRYVNRLEFLWEKIRKGQVEFPEFVHDHDDELESRPLMDYGIEVDRCRDYDAPAVDSSAASMYSLRCS